MNILEGDVYQTIFMEKGDDTIRGIYYQVKKSDNKKLKPSKPNETFELFGMLQRFRKTFCSRIPLMESPEIQPLYN
jgi:hypothetical protein